MHATLLALAAMFDVSLADLVGGAGSRPCDCVNSAPEAAAAAASVVVWGVPISVTGTTPRSLGNHAANAFTIVGEPMTIISRAVFVGS